MDSVNDGYLHVARFVEVVSYNPEVYPKGIKYYDVTQGGADSVSKDNETKAHEDEDVA
jgi:hypothetical protein